METMTLKIKKLGNRVIIPTYGSDFSAGADLYSASDDTTILPGQSRLMSTQLSFEIPEGYVGLIYARSGLATKKGLAPANKVGVIDSDYRGEVLVCLHNHSSAPQTVALGERIAQIVITPYLKCNFTPCDDLSDTTRGQGGFGSTGQK
ncbi:MAG: dUTP diphosphatase [Clostridia bacterium]|nr:dUTP diphosphatase [Clostridia bacterium]